MGWPGINLIIPSNLFVLLERWSGERRNKKVLRGFWLIWCATIWVLWKTRNDESSIMWQNG